MKDPEIEKIAEGIVDMFFSRGASVDRNCYDQVMLDLNCYADLRIKKYREEVAAKAEELMPNPTEVNYEEDNFYAGRRSALDSIIDLLSPTEPKKGQPK